MNETPHVIRPMTLGEILDKAIRLYRQNFLTFVGIFAIPYIPMVIIQMVFSVLYTTTLMGPNSLQNTDPTMVMGLGIATIISSVVFLIANFILVSGFATAAITRAVANNYMDKPIGILDSYRGISGSVWKLIWTIVLCTLLLFLVLIWSIVPIVGWFSGPGILFFLGWIVTPLVAPIIILEKRGITQSIRRAWDLGRSRFWWLIGYTLVLSLLGQLIVTGPVFLLSAILRIALSSIPDMGYEMQTMVDTIVSNLLTMSLGLLYSPLQLTMMTVVYFDLRARSEGLDLALQLSSLNENQTEPSPALPEIASTDTSRLFAGIDIGRFALLSLIAFVLFGCYFFFIFPFALMSGGL